MEIPPPQSSSCSASENGENNDSGQSNQESQSNRTNTQSNTDRSSTSEALAIGLTTMLETVIRDFDSKAHDTFTSQDHLNSAIDRLTGELDQLLEDAPLPFIMQHAVKISGVRKRVLSLNSVLKSIQRRLDNIDRMLSAGTLQEKTIAQSSGLHL